MYKDDPVCNLDCSVVGCHLKPSWYHSSWEEVFRRVFTIDCRLEGFLAVKWFHADSARQSCNFIQFLICMVTIIRVSTRVEPLINIIETRLHATALSSKPATCKQMAQKHKNLETKQRQSNPSFIEISPKAIHGLNLRQTDWWSFIETFPQETFESSHLVAWLAER